MLPLDYMSFHVQVVSCEMIEAVGHENLPAYFRAISTFLKPGGQAVIQVCCFPAACIYTAPVSAISQSWSLEMLFGHYELPRERLGLSLSMKAALSLNQMSLPVHLIMT